MVATKLHEVTSKGLDWAYTTGPATNSPSKGNTDPPPPSFDTGVQDDSYYTYAKDSLWSVYDQTQSTLTSAVSSLYTDSSSPSPAVESLPAADPTDGLKASAIKKNEWRRKSSTIKLKYPELQWLLKNPYSNARGVHDRPSSLSALRSLLVHVHHSENVPEKKLTTLAEQDDPMPEGDALYREASNLSLPGDEPARQRNKNVSNDETAQKLSEGCLRALRDLTLTEAADLHYALKYWTTRWERPFLSWIEAGPLVWFSEDGYNHQKIGQKVSQIQAVLARRCAAVGELQQHLLRAGWQKGVAQWGVLGQGDQWAQIAGGDGTMDDSSTGRNGKRAHSFSTDTLDTQKAALSSRRRSTFIGSSADNADVPLPPGNSIGESEENVHAVYYGHAKVPVKNTRGGEIVKDDPALAAWSVDAMRLIRALLYGAGHGMETLPYEANWIKSGEQTSKETIRTEGESNVVSLPIWATRTSPDATAISEVDSLEDLESRDRVETSEVRITDIPLMASEVSELLNSMEVIMESQRNRRVQKLKPPQRMRRNWYLTALGAPIATYVFYTLAKEGAGFKLAREVIEKISSFYQDHVSEPLRAVYYELFTRRGRETISDRNARMDAIASCKNMIRSWLDETYPEMDEKERQTRADQMDFSLIEKKKEESIKTIFEINSVVRMSLIEIQFIKKELMNALYAMDEMMSSNEININLAAVTPAVLVMYSAKYAFRLLFYAFLRLGRSREETYASFRQVILDIERLLVMRDNPPMSPPPLGWVENDDPPPAQTVTTGDSSVNVLSSDDLGMLVLLIHECRTILWRDRRRFSPQIRRNVSEDLAELAGERGAVSVQQQLQIIARMCRTYPFLKVISTGFEFSQAILP